MKLRRVAALAVVAAASLLAVAGCGSSRPAHGQNVFGFAGTRLAIQIDSSDLRLVPGTGLDITVQRWLSGTAAEPGHASWTLRGSTLRLGIDCSGLVFHCGSAYQVAVPPGVAVVVHSGSGTVTVSGLPSQVTITGGSGDVHVNGASGSLRVHTGSGSITAAGLRSPVVRATTDQGSVDVAFTTAPRLVEISSGTGNATARVPTARHRYHVTVTSGTGTARSQVPDDPSSARVIQVTSHNGDATVLPAS